MFIKFLKNYSPYLIFWSLILGCPTYLTAQKYAGSPMTKIRLIKVIESREYALPKIVQVIQEHGVDFQVTSTVEQELLAIKTRPQIISAIKENFREPVVAKTPVNPGTPKSNITIGSKTIPKASTQEDTTDKYEQLFYQGVQLINQLRTVTTPQQYASIVVSVRDTGLQAMKLDSSRPEAYKLLSMAYLFGGIFDQAEKYAQQAINLGGDLAYPVYHMSGTPHLEVLHIGKGFITVESNQKFFEYNQGNVMNLQPEGDYNMSGKTVAVFSLSTYKNNTGADWFFVPANTGTGGEAYMIMRLIKKNVVDAN